MSDNKDKTMENNGSAEHDRNSIIDMMLGSKREGRRISDTETLITETQKRVWKSLKAGFEYTHKVDLSEAFLRKRVYSKLPMVVMYVDLVGSTDMILTLPTEKVATIVSSFAQEVGYVIDNHHGFVLKYVGDAVIGYFIAEENPLLAADNAVNCAKSILSIVEKGINPILSQYDYPELFVKIGMDFAENTIVRYGSDKERSHVDILGPGMSIAAKITSLSKPNQILVGEDIFEKLHPTLKEEFKVAPQYTEGKWSYRNRESGNTYKIYSYTS